MWYIYKMEYGSAIKKIKLLKMQANGWSYKQSKWDNPDQERQMYHLFYHFWKKELYSKWPKLNLEHTPM